MAYVGEVTTSNGRPVRWSQRTGAERLEMYTQWSMYAVYAIEPFMAALLLTGATPSRGAWPVVYLVGTLVHAVIAAQMFLALVRAYGGRAEPPRRQVWLLAGVTAALWAVAVLFYPGVESGAAALGMMIPTVGTLGSLALLLRRAVTAIPVTLATTAAAFAVLAVLGADRAQLIGVAVGGWLALLGGALSFRLSAWTMRVVWELDDARAVAGRLAVAEERLRFSRDLHDVFGRTLSTVAVKSELAAALAERGDPRGSEEMLEVRQLAHDALREVRGVIQGYRSADLDTEIAGARALLASAAVECRVAGEGLAITQPVAEAASWVVREAVTNVVRHAMATWCTIEVREHDGGCRVRVANDGVPAGTDPSRGGSGLQGLRERLTARGGSLVVEVGEGEFVVEARIPPWNEETT